MTHRDWSIQEVARLAGTTSRTLRHYDDIGLLAPSRIAANGYRHYDGGALVRLQRILLLRQLGLGLPRIGEVLAAPNPPSGRGAAGEASALESHLAHLRAEQDRLARQITAVQSTIRALKGGEELMAETMFDGFDHTQHREEVEERWGKEAYATSDRWWRSMSEADKADWKKRVADLTRDWVAAADSGMSPESADAQALAQRHVEWLTAVPGTPAAAGSDVKGYVQGLGDMYVADPRFGANYGGEQGAAFVRDALRIYAETNL